MTDEKELLEELKKTVDNLQGEVNSLKKKKENKLASRKFWVVLIFGFGYPILKGQFNIDIPPESVYIIVAYLLGQSAVDLLKEKLPKVGGTSGQAGTSEQK